jgi:hypothetical protein
MCNRLGRLPVAEWSRACCTTYLQSHVRECRLRPPLCKVETAVSSLLLPQGDVQCQWSSSGSALPSHCECMAANQTDKPHFLGSVSLSPLEDPSDVQVARGGGRRVQCAGAGSVAVQLRVRPLLSINRPTWASRNSATYSGSPLVAPGRLMRTISLSSIGLLHSILS